MAITSLLCIQLQSVTWISVALFFQSFSHYTYSRLGTNFHFYTYYSQICVLVLFFHLFTQWDFWKRKTYNLDFFFFSIMEISFLWINLVFVAWMCIFFLYICIFPSFNGLLCFFFCKVCWHTNMLSVVSNTLTHILRIHLYMGNKHWTGTLCPLGHCYYLTIHAKPKPAHWQPEVGLSFPVYHFCTLAFIHTHTQ